MLNLHLLLGITDSPAQTNTLMQTKKSTQFFCGFLKNYFCLKRENFNHFTHHLFVQWGIPKKITLSGPSTASPGKSCSQGAGPGEEKERGREGRQKRWKRWGTRSGSVSRNLLSRPWGHQGHRYDSETNSVSTSPWCFHFLLSVEIIASFIF